MRATSGILGGKETSSRARRRAWIHIFNPIFNVFVLSNDDLVEPA